MQANEERLEFWQDNEPCDHEGCLDSQIYPCEVCGRVGGRGLALKQRFKTVFKAPLPTADSFTIEGSFLGINEQHWLSSPAMQFADGGSVCFGAVGQRRPNTFREWMRFAYNADVFFGCVPFLKSVAILSFVLAIAAGLLAGWLLR